MAVTFVEVADSPSPAAPPAVPRRSPAADRATDAIDRTFRRLARAWSTGDAAAVGQLLAADCDHLTLSGSHRSMRGRDELLATWQQAFSRRSAAFSIRMTPVLHAVRRLSADLALVDGALQYSDGFGAKGVARSQCSQPFTAVMQRTCDEWLVLSLRAAAAMNCDD